MKKAAMTDILENEKEILTTQNGATTKSQRLKADAYSQVNQKVKQKELKKNKILKSSNLQQNVSDDHKFD